jgi:hypothetical protein
MGGRPSGHISAIVSGGTKAWADGAKLWSGFSWAVPSVGSENQSLAYAVADEPIDTLRNAMRKARGK